MFNLAEYISVLFNLARFSSAPLNSAEFNSGLKHGKSYDRANTSNRVYHKDSSLWKQALTNFKRKMFLFNFDKKNFQHSKFLHVASK